MLQSLSLLIRTPIPSWGSTRMTSSKPNDFSKALQPYTIALGVRVSTCKFGGRGDTNVQTLTFIHCKTKIPSYSTITLVHDFPFIFLLSRINFQHPCVLSTIFTAAEAATSFEAYPDISGYS